MAKRNQLAWYFEGVLSMAANVSTVTYYYLYSIQSIYGSDILAYVKMAISGYNDSNGNGQK